MSLYQFVGVDPSNVALPDGTVVSVSPGDVVDLGTLVVGPLWQPTVAGPNRADPLDNAPPLNS